MTKLPVACCARLIDEEALFNPDDVRLVADIPGVNPAGFSPFEPPKENWLFVPETTADELSPEILLEDPNVNVAA